MIARSTISSTQFQKWILVGALLLGVVGGVLLPHIAVGAQDMEPQTFYVLAGDTGAYNTAVLAFGPQSLQVHRGDTVTWLIDSFHNIHFETTLSELVIAPEVDGQPLPQFNPAIAFPTIENGGVFTGGDANSGVGLDPANPMLTFSLVMDVEPGVYGYMCDIHPGMVGNITVVDDATPIPSPDEAMTIGAAQLAITSGLGLQAAMEASMQPPVVGDDGALAVSAGVQSGTAAVLAFFPATAVIEAGETVTWTIPENSMEPHTVTSPALPPGSEFNIIPQEAGPPILALSEAAFPSLENGASVGADGAFNTGFMFPGQSFTLTFTEPGVYSYVCFIHAGMQGTVVVTEPA
jgi:plastocyanin